MVYRLNVSTYSAHRLEKQTYLRGLFRDQSMLTLEDSVWLVSVNKTLADQEPLTGEELTAAFTLTKGSLPHANVSITLEFEHWNRESYVFAPAAVYNGNRYRIGGTEYPPMLHEADGIGAGMETTITDVPHLNREGDGSIELLSGDMATPCFGVFDKAAQQGYLVYTTHQTRFGYQGMIFREEGATASLEIQAPGVRQKMYAMMHSDLPSDDEGYSFNEGDTVEIGLKIFSWKCLNFLMFYETFWKTRTCMQENRIMENSLPFSKVFELVEKKYIETQWNEVDEYLMIAPKGMGKFGDWQAGWVGGGMNSLAFLSDGNAVSAEMAEKTLTTVFTKLQTDKGYIVPIMFQGTSLGDDFCHQEKTEILLIRKNADVLAFACRHILLKKARRQAVPEVWLEGVRKLADAFIRLWVRHKQWGQFVSTADDGIIMGGTACAGIAIGGLALCCQLFEEVKYIHVAQAAAEHYFSSYIREGLLNGGPGEILQCPDSESAFGLLDGLVTLYEITGEKKWLSYAVACGHQCASWCVTYDFSFPAASEFGRLDLKTTGSVYANVQNKHSAPGICTLSPLALLKLYRYTGDEGFLELCYEIAHNTGQYLSREGRPIFSWDGKVLPSGWMCERVNMSDWEGKSSVGGVFYGSCWCEISALLTYSEIPGIWFMKDTGRLVVFDHVTAEVEAIPGGWRLKVANPTGFDARVKLHVERESEWGHGWGEAALARCKVMNVAAGSRTILEIERY